MKKSCKALRRDAIETIADFAAKAYPPQRGLSETIGNIVVKTTLQR